MAPWTLRWPDGAFVDLDIVAGTYALVRPDRSRSVETPLGNVLTDGDRSVLAWEMPADDPAVIEHVANHGRRGCVLMAEVTRVPQEEREAFREAAERRKVHRLRTLCGMASGPAPCWDGCR